MTAEKGVDEVWWHTQARAGDQAAFTHLFERYRSQLQQHLDGLSLAPTTNRESLLQAIGQRAQERLSTLTADQDFGPWLLDICRDYVQETIEEQQRAEEALWVQQTLTGDHSAFARLFERYQSAVYTHAYYRLNSPVEAQDAVQEVFQRAYLKLETFDQTRRFRAWLLTIAANYCTDVLRSRRSPRRSAHWVALDAVDYWIADTDADPQQQVQENEQQEVVRAAVRQLDEKYRDLMILFYWNDLSYAEISQVTGLKESTIKTRLHRARKELIDILQAQAPARAQDA